MTPLQGQMLVFYALNPDMKMSTRDLVRKFGGNAPKDATVYRNVLRSADTLTAERWLACTRERGNHGARVFSAGPVLLENL